MDLKEETENYRNSLEKGADSGGFFSPPPWDDLIRFTD
jgi:hypothetical protein